MNSTPLQQAATQGAELAALDIVGLVLVGILVLLGIWRGLWWQVIRLAGVIVAVALARAFGAGLAEPIAERWPDISPRIVHGISWIGIFLVALGAATLLGLLGNKLIEAMKLGLVNRLGGAVVGAITGLLVHTALLVAICQLAPESFVTRVVSGTWSEKLYESVGSRWRIVLSEDAGTQVDSLLRRAHLLELGPDPAHEGGAATEGDGSGKKVR